MGSAALYHLARRGARVLGLDRFAAGHDRGSSHGETRIIRLAYFEHPSYVPLVRRAYELWRELEADAARPLLHVTGIAEIGPPDGALVTGTLAAARLHDIPHELLAAPRTDAAVSGIPAAAGIIVGVVQPDGGFVEAEPSVQAMLALAQRARRGNALWRDRCARSSRADDGVRIVTDGATIEAGAAIVAAGPWTTSLLPGCRAAAARDAAGHGLVRAERDPATVRAGPLPGVPARKRARHPLWLPAVRRPASRSRSITIATRRSTRTTTTGLSRPRTRR